MYTAHLFCNCQKIALFFSVLEGQITVSNSNTHFLLVLGLISSFMRLIAAILRGFVMAK